MSVEPVGRVSHSPRLGNIRPSASEFLRYNAAIVSSCRISA